MPKKTFYLVPYAHLDSQWRWTFVTTIRRYIKNTLQDNFKLFEKYPHYCFNFTGTLRYEMMKDYYPDQYARLKEYVAKGRWKLAGSCLEETDSLVPSPESLIRNILYGNQFFKNEFGEQSYDYMLPDCFGFPASLPSVLTHCGIKGFSTQKLTWHSIAGIPFSVGLWRGLDGSLLPAALNAGNYITRLRRLPRKNKKFITRLEKNGADSGVYKDYHYYGVGDIGGAPKENSVRYAEKELSADDTIFCQDASAKLFLDLTDDEKEKLLIYQGDLLLTEHSAGSLTSQAIMKRFNHRNEFLADAAERAAALAQVSAAGAYPYAKLLAGWKRVIASQMHDILPGTCTPETYTYAYNDEAVALNTFNSVLHDAAENITGLLDTRTDGVPVVVYNPLACDRESIVDLVLPDAASVSVIDPSGNTVASQIVSHDGKNMHVAFYAYTAPVSWNVYDVQLGKNALPAVADLSVKENDFAFILENRKLRVTVAKTGYVESVFDKMLGEEMLSGSIHYELLNESPAQFPAWNMDWKDRNKKPFAITEPAECVSLVENGPVRATVQVKRKYKESEIVQNISLSCSQAGAALEFTDMIDWHSKGVSLKAAFPLAVKNKKATYNWRAGKVTRGNNYEKQYEFPSHLWFDLGDEKKGVSILSDAKYGSDKPSDDVLRLTLLFTPARPCNSVLFFDQRTQDWGRHTIRYAFYSHASDWRTAKTDQRALCFSQPLYPFIARPSDGLLGKTFSMFRLSTDSVLVSAVKCAENMPDVLIIRMTELHGKQADAVHLLCPAAINDAWEVNGQEERTGSVSYTGNKAELSFSPYMIRSIALKIKLQHAANGKKRLWAACSSA